MSRLGPEDRSACGTVARLCPTRLGGEEPGRNDDARAGEHSLVEAVRRSRSARRMRFGSLDSDVPMVCAVGIEPLAGRSVLMFAPSAGRDVPPSARGKGPLFEPLARLKVPVFEPLARLKVPVFEPLARLKGLPALRRWPGAKGFLLCAVGTAQTPTGPSVRTR